MKSNSKFKVFKLYKRHSTLFFKFSQKRKKIITKKQIRKTANELQILIAKFNEGTNFTPISFKEFFPNIF